jgi:hypothetical protein
LVVDEIKRIVKESEILKYGWQLGHIVRRMANDGPQGG